MSLLNNLSHRQHKPLPLSLQKRTMAQRKAYGTSADQRNYGVYASHHYGWWVGYGYDMTPAQVQRGKYLSRKPANDDWYVVVYKRADGKWTCLGYANQRVALGYALMGRERGYDIKSYRLRDV